jgi:NADPH:quinone reductase
MRAVVVRRNGVELIETAVPEPAAGQVRIAVAAAGINPVELGTINGGLVAAGIAAQHEQYGLGWDVAGTVDATGPGVDLSAGTPVVGLSDQTGIPLKTHADFVVLDASSVASAPRNASLVEAATLPLNALTALQALDRLALNTGDTVLVTGAAGGVGGYAVQLAKHRGLKVVATAGPDDEKVVTDLGADLVVPRSADLNLAVRAELPGGVDGAIDAAVLGVAALDAVRNHGSFAALIGPPPPGLRGITVHHVLIVADGNQLADLVGLVDSGDLTLRVADTYPLSEAETAYTRLAKGGLRGRLVLIP